MLKRYYPVLILVAVGIIITLSCVLHAHRKAALSAQLLYDPAQKDVVPAENLVQPLPQPATLADAQAAYKNSDGHQAFEETADGYIRMVCAFRDHGWYDRCLEECDEIEQRFPDDVDTIVWVQLLKAHASAKLGHRQEAYAMADAVDARYRDEHTLRRRDGIPVNTYAHIAALGTKQDFLEEEHKYHEAAAMNDQVIADILTSSDAATKHYVETHKELTEWACQVDRSDMSAYLYYKAGEYSTALSRYTAILTFLSTHDDLKGEECAFMRHYAVPVEIAMCQMKLSHYADTLKSYQAIENNLSSPAAQRQTFFKLPERINDHEITENTLAASFFTRVDLQTRLAECLIRLNEKKQAKQALTKAMAQLNDQDFLTKIKQPYSLSPYNIAHRWVDNSWIDELNTTTIPALKKEIDEL